ncbi:MAG: tetratricopeptide repeat protein [Cyclobacteriaceae bacterium]
MKRVILFLLVIPFVLQAQKPIKPSVPKAEAALKAGDLAEAKAIIDATTESQDFMVDKKGNPSKQAAKAWYLKGVIYTSIDTSTNEQYKSLVSDPYSVASEAFSKSKELDPEQSVFVTGANGFPILPEQANQYFAQSYFNKAVSAYQDENDYKKAFDFVEKTLSFVPKDTSILLNAGLFFAPGANEHEKAVQYLKTYQELGGGSTDAYLMLFSIYRDKLKDNESALAIIKEARAKHPTNSEFPKYELNIYLSEKKYDLAKSMIEKDLAAHPDDKEGYYLLGQLNREMGDIAGAKQAFEKAMSIDPQYFDAVAGLTDLYWQDAKKVKDEMGKLGISKEDMAKRVALDKQYIEKLKVYLPYLEKCEKIEPDNVNILYQLLNVYQDLDDQPKIARVKKSLKRLGEEVD